MREFYAIDPATAADETQLNQKALLGRGFPYRSGRTTSRRF
ncbi:MAG: hypothetical protein ACLURV_00835 [Gallintestinimicrobium sp.]